MFSVAAAPVFTIQKHSNVCLVITNRFVISFLQTDVPCNTCQGVRTGSKKLLHAYDGRGAVRQQTLSVSKCEKMENTISWSHFFMERFSPTI